MSSNPLANVPNADALTQFLSANPPKNALDMRRLIDGFADLLNSELPEVGALHENVQIANGVVADVVVPKGRIPELFELIDRLKSRFGMPIPSFGHIGDGNIHVNIMVKDTAAAIARAREAEAELLRGVVALDGSISGEHGIGFSKAGYLGLELGAEAIALMKRVKDAFDPHGILNPGKIFPDLR